MESFSHVDHNKEQNIYIYKQLMNRIEEDVKKTVFFCSILCSIQSLIAGITTKLLSFCYQTLAVYFKPLTTSFYIRL